MCEAVISSKCRAVPSSQLPDGGWRTSCLHCCSDLQAVRIVLGGVYPNLCSNACKMVRTALDERGCQVLK